MANPTPPDLVTWVRTRLARLVTIISGTKETQKKMFNTKIEDEITEYPDLIAEQIRALLEKRDALKAEIQELEDAGIAGANPHYREGKYLYLIYPTQPDGSRKREYIGNKPQAIQEALARVQRFKIHATKSRELKDLESKLRSVGYELSQILNRLQRNHKW